jgi:hypothetical protein
MSTTNNENMKLPHYHCCPISRDLLLSGKVDDPLWQRAETVPLVDAVRGQAGRYRTTVRLLHNDRYLYLAFQCEDQYVWGTHSEHDAPIYDEECVEAFLCPSGKTRQYYEIDVSPRGTVFDAFILNGRAQWGPRTNLCGLTQYTCEGLVTKIHIDGELGVPGARGWSAEFAIPFASLVGSDDLVPRAGEQWRMNLYRIDAPQAGQQELYAWSPPGVADFHCPWCFGVLEF